MSYNTVARLLQVPPVSVSILVSEGLENQYSLERSLLNRSHGPGRHARRERKIYRPSERLKIIQRKIAQLTSSRFEPHAISQAYVKDRSVVTNAARHIGAKAVLHLDISNFFGAISRDRVLESLAWPLREVAADDRELIADLCCYKGFLPAGSPTSPVLSNLVCYTLDGDLEELAKSCGCVVGRYSDDISVSTTEAQLPSDLVGAKLSCPPQTADLGEPLLALFALHDFRLNLAKVRIETRPGPMASPIRVTGCNVDDEGVTVPRKHRDYIRAALHRWRVHGLANCGHQHPKGSAQAFASSLRGRIAYLGQVEGRTSRHYLRFQGEFAALEVRDAAQLNRTNQTPEIEAPTARG